MNELISDFIIGVITAIVSTTIIAFITMILKKIIVLLSQYSGKWESLIYDNNGNVVKTDTLILSEIGGKIKGNMRRISPIEQNDREWIVSGFVQKGHILLAIKAKNERQASDGSVYVIQTDDNIYTGCYLKAVGNNVDQHPICLRKVN